MTRDEVKMVLATMAEVYSRHLMPPVTELTVNVWLQMLQDVSYKSASAAVAGWLQTQKYPPTIADIREMVTRTVTEIEISPEQAWSELMAAIQKYGHTEKDKAEKALGERTRKIVGGDWMYYCTLPLDQLPNEKARFLRAYTSEQKRGKELAQMSERVRLALTAPDATKKLEAGHDG